MQATRRKKAELVRLEGCKHCERKCRWTGNVASKDVAKNSPTPYNCNTSKRR